MTTPSGRRSNLQCAHAQQQKCVMQNHQLTKGRGAGWAAVLLQLNPAWAAVLLRNVPKHPFDKSPSQREFRVCPFLAS